MSNLPLNTLTCITISANSFVLLKKEVAMAFIEQVPKTALDVFRMLPEGTLCEVIDNVLYMSPAPKYNHQRLTGLIYRRLSNHVEETGKGEVLISPFDVYLEHFLSAVQPDVLYVSNENRDILKEDGYIHGAPDLIVEVLSTDIQRDKVQKKSLYERAGVKEYFIVNPKDNKVLAYALNNTSTYDLVYEAIGHFKSALLNYEFRF
jgi:Uma2 family endonuclease